LIKGASEAEALIVLAVMTSGLWLVWFFDFKMGREDFAVLSYVAD